MEVGSWVSQGLDPDLPCILFYTGQQNALHLKAKQEAAKTGRGDKAERHSEVQSRGSSVA